MSEAALYAEERAKTTARRQRWLRRGRGCAFVTGALVLSVGSIVGVAWLIIWWIDASAVAGALNDARKAGAPLTPAELAAFCAPGPEHVEPTKRWQAVFHLPGVMPTSDKAIEGVPFIDWQRSDESGTPPARDARGMLTGKDLQIGGEYVASLRDAIEAAHEARRAGGVARFPVTFAGEIFPQLPHLGTLQRLATLIRLDMEVQLADGETDAAVEDLLTLLAIRDIAAEEPFSASYYVGYPIQEGARKGFERMLRTGKLSDEQLVRIDEAFARTKARESFHRSLAGERYMFVSLFETEEANPYAAWQVTEPWFKGADLAKGVEWYGRLEKASESSLREAMAEYKTIEAEMGTIASDPATAASYPLSMVHFPSMTYGLPIHQKAESSEAVVRTAIACERFRRAEGRFPQKLDDLVPKYLDPLPIDAYDGKPLRYAVEAKGARIYSVGPDLVDDGGGMPPNSAAAVFTPSDDVIYLTDPDASEASP